jgi:hypothetical protein
LQAELAKRQVPYTKAEWLADSVHNRFFWSDLAKASIAPILCVFFACICVGGLVNHQTAVGTQSDANPRNA